MHMHILLMRFPVFYTARHSVYSVALLTGTQKFLNYHRCVSIDYNSVPTYILLFGDGFWLVPERMHPDSVIRKTAVVSIFGLPSLVTESFSTSD